MALNRGQSRAWTGAAPRPRPGKIYLHVFDWPEGGQIRLSGLQGVGQSLAAYLLSDASQSPLAVTYQDNELTISGPSEAPDAIDTVITLIVE